MARGVKSISVTPPRKAAKAATRSPSRRLTTINVKVLRMPHADGLPLPAYQTAGSAGLDLVAAVDAKKPVKLRAGTWALIPTGLILELPLGTEAQVRPRSGLALKHGVTVLNSPGTIDADYRGEVQVMLINHGRKIFAVTRGERIAQLVIARVSQVKLIETRIVTETKRGAGGFGSTGSRAKPPRTRLARA